MWRVLHDRRVLGEHGLIVGEHSDTLMNQAAQNNVTSLGLLCGGRSSSSNSHSNSLGVSLMPQSNGSACGSGFQSGGGGALSPIMIPTPLESVLTLHKVLTDRASKNPA